MIFETICVGAFEVNCYILAEDADSQAVIIDPGDEEGKIKDVLGSYKLKPAFIVNTHGHIDHIACDDKFNVPVYAHKDEAAMLKSRELNLSAFLNLPFCVKSQVIPVEDGRIISLGKIELQVIHTPGHTQGGMCLLMRKPLNDMLFSGDTLFREGVGRTDLAGGDTAMLVKSIREKLFVLADEIKVYPGHGEATTIGYEKKNNPFMG